jgi:flagella basal body P-ring formation protein FlgA
MKDKWICLTMAIALTALTWGAKAAENFEQAAIDKIIDRLELDTSTCKVEIIRTGLELNLPAFDSLDILPTGEIGTNGLIPLVATIYQTDGQIKARQIRARVSRYAETLIAADRLKPRELLSPEKVSLARMEVTGLLDKPLTSLAEAEGKWTKHGVGKGQILTTGMLEPIPEIVSGQTVSIVYKTSNLEITVVGSALEAGYRDQTIKVRNNQSGRTINCRVIDRTTVAAPES